MRVLVTGGGGFIGSHVVDRLQERGITPRIFDLSASPYHSPLEVETFTGSITDAANLDLAMRDCDAVIHLAAVADVGHVLAIKRLGVCGQAWGLQGQRRGLR